MHTLTMDEKLALNLSHPAWYEAVALSDEEVDRLRAFLPIWGPLPAYMKGTILVGTRPDKTRVHLVRLGKMGSAVAPRRRKWLERIGCREEIREEGEA